MAKHYLQLSSVLKKLLYIKRMKPSDLAREVNLPSPTIHRLVTGKSTRPYESSLKPIADYFSIKVEQLLGEEPLSFNEPSAQYAVNLPETKNVSQLPLIPWEKLPGNKITKEMDKVPFVGPIGSEGFATIMPDTSMEPLIQRNSILIFDPTITPIDRSYVLVNLHETGAYVLRILLVDADQRYLKPLNPDLSTFKMRLLQREDLIIACLVEARHNFRVESRSGMPNGVNA